jgi:hypothetical protein
MAITGTVSTRLMTSRWRSGRTGPARAVPAAGSAPALAVGLGGGAGRRAVWPAFSTPATSSAGAIVSGKLTLAFSVA